MNSIENAVTQAREQGLPMENYWLYFKKDGSMVEAKPEEHKRKDWIGFFVEDDTRLRQIAKIAGKKTDWKE
jgi:hypothetical protein